MRTAHWFGAACIAGALAFGGANLALAANEAPVTVSKSFPAGKVVVDGFHGTVIITTAAPGGPVTIRAAGRPEYMKRLDIRQDAGGVLIRLESASSRVWWPWSMLDWSQQREDDILLTIGAPKGTAFDMDDMSGRVTAGDLDAPLRFDGQGGGTAKFGNVTQARISIAGSMDVTMGHSQSAVDVDLAGSGSLTMASAPGAKLSIAGSGSFKSAALAGGLDASIAGSGEAEAASVNGPVSISVAGSGNIVIKGGRADPFKVAIAGSGDVVFDGEAVNPDIDIAGSGNVTVGTMSGRLRQDIQGAGEFTVRRSAPTPPPPPPPPAPAAPPAPQPPPAPPSTP